MAFTTERRIEFRDTDAAGIVHFSVFFPLMESAEHEMLRSLGLSVLPQGHGDGPDANDIADSVTWPRVAASCNYLQTVRFEDMLSITVTVVKIGTSSVQYHFDFACQGAKIATGSMTAVCCRLYAGVLEKAEIPDSIRQLLAQHQ